ncbi:unnamed protein product [Thlaspi arvense]|uniref:Uncharacterized protein n=1 Tax=Thlaspi arvense TaxID=13288 RepID=A0AAU9RQY7_THLAR|nr:unnamed protein product [Thlaspi arvense]
MSFYRPPVFGVFSSFSPTKTPELPRPSSSYIVIKDRLCKLGTFMLFNGDCYVRSGSRKKQRHR